MALTRLKLFRGDTLDKLVESFAGFAELVLGPPTGDAGGDLDATYPDPAVVAIHSGVTRLPIGAVADTQFLKRVGGNIVGAAVPPPPEPVQAQYNGNNVNIGDGNTANLPWNPRLNGDDLLDLTDPLFPHAKVAGLWIVTAYLLPNSQLTLAGCYEGRLSLAAHDAVQDSASKTANPNNPPLYVTCTAAAVLAVGDAVNIALTNYDGAVARDFGLARASVAVMPT